MHGPRLTAYITYLIFILISVLEVVTDGQVVITEVRVQTSDLGSIDKSG